MTTLARTALQSALVALLISAGAVDASASGIVINEIRTGQPGEDIQDYFELAGGPSNSLMNLYYLVIGDNDLGRNSGVIEKSFLLGHQEGHVFGNYYLAANGFTFPTPNSFPGNSVSANFAYGFGLEDDDNVTHLLVSNYCSETNCSPSEDLDINDDGVLDYTPWDAILDSVSIIKDPTGGEKYYSPNVVGPDGLTSPTHIYRSPDRTGPWVIGDYDGLPNGFQDTPGAANPTVPEPTTLCYLILGVNFLILTGRNRDPRNA